MIKEDNKANGKNVVAAFDFDGTITTKDTLFHFAKFVLGWFKFAVALLFFLPTAFKLFTKQMSNAKAKEVLFTLFFKSFEIEKLQEYSKQYANEIDKILNKEALEKINYHKSKGHKLTIVSASVEIWIVPWAQKMGFEKVIATKAEIQNGKITGNFASANCNGPEKPVRFLEQYPERKEYQLYAYGDTTGDLPLLKLADYPFYKKYN